ncbi:MFS transporter [Maribacter litoralis]|uniref:MFS transporter, DHA1 family, arabinose polymer transporter n=1 Tax=Maribacter litoralis TaxID=2059726 RepID=A0A653VXP4_9FLAO|nr:MFS transporter [Maribacter litoralis]VXC10373.1 MFS transporter, DHA1 family, arabinose polymer transporter [Maribacter litoralis]
MENLKSNKKALFALAIGGFGIGLTEFVIMGILTEVSGSLGITIPQAGHFIAAYALGVVVGAPLLTGLGSKLSPKKMLFLLMIWFTVFNTLSGLATGYSSLLFLRFLSGIPHGAFFGIGAVVATKLAKKGKGAQAISIMFSGLTVANVIGVPIGTYLGQQFSWSVSFYLVGFVGLLALGSIYLWMPKIEVDDQEEKVTVSQGLKNSELWALIALTTIGTGGFFAWYSYVAPLITDVAGLPDHFVGYAMMLAGLGMVAGNFLGAKMAEWFSPLKAVIISLSVMCGILLLNMMIATNPYLLMVLTFVIGAISFTVATPIQMAIINTSKGSEMLGSSMNQSAFNMGNASGAYLAGLPIAFGYGIVYSSLVGAILAFSGVAIAIGILIVRKRKENKYRKMAMGY